MKPTSLVSIAFLVSSIVLSAQNATFGVAQMEGMSNTGASKAGIVDLSKSGSSTQTTVLQASVVGQYCPVSLRAQHGASAGMLQADRNRPQGLAQVLHLTLINPDSRQIVSARFEVRGITGKARVSQALSYPGNGSADITRTVEARFSPAPGKAVTGDLRVPGMTAVLTINAVSVTFDDGSTQNFTARDACRVAPDLTMLVTGR